MLKRDPVRDFKFGIFFFVITVAAFVPTKKLVYSQTPETGIVLTNPSYGSRVVFSDSGWKQIGRVYLLDPRSGASFRFTGRTFGHDFKTFLLWGYRANEHRWAEKLEQIADEHKKQERFLREWIERALRNGEISPPNSLEIAYPVVTSEKTADLQPIRLTQQNEDITISRQRIGSYDFFWTELLTSVKISGRTVPLNTTIYITGYHYIEWLDDWEFFAALSQVPTDVPAEQQQRLRQLFTDTVSTLSLRRAPETAPKLK